MAPSGAITIVFVLAAIVDGRRNRVGAGGFPDIDEVTKDIAIASAGVDVAGHRAIAPHEPTGSLLDQFNHFAAGVVLQEKHKQQQQQQQLQQQQVQHQEAKLHISYQRSMVADRLSEGSSMLEVNYRDILENLDVTAGLLFGVGLIAYCLKILFVDYPEAQLAVKRGAQRNVETGRQYYDSVKQMMVELEAIRERSARLAQLHFQEQHRGFLRFLKGIDQGMGQGSADLDSIPGQPFFKPVRDLIVMWMRAFEFCSVDPETDPVVLCAPEKVDACATLMDIAKTIVAESQGKMGDMAGEDMKAAQELHNRIAEQHKNDLQQSRAGNTQGLVQWVWNLGLSCDRHEPSQPFPLDLTLLCVRFTFLSPWHFWMRLGVLVGLNLAVLEHVQGEHLVGACVDLALVLMVWVLLITECLDEKRRLDNEFAGLRDKLAIVEDQKQKMIMWTEKFDRVSKLWQYRTMNLLDLFSAIGGLISGQTSMSPECAKEKAEYVAMVNIKLVHIVENFGMPRWYLEAAIDDELLEVASQQMGANICRLSKLVDQQDLEEIAKLLDNIFGLVFLHIRGAHDLPKMENSMVNGKAAVVDAFAVVRMGDVKPEDCPKTSVVQDSLDPSWNQDFYLLAPADKDTFILEVFDSDEDSLASKHGEATARQGIGFVQIQFRNHPGKWVEKSEHLLTFDQKETLQSTIEYRYCFASSIQQLAAFDKEPVDMERVRFDDGKGFDEFRRTRQSVKSVLTTQNLGTLLGRPEHVDKYFEDQGSVL